MMHLPDIIKNTYGTSSRLDIISEFYSSRTVFMFGSIDDEMAESLLLQLLYLNSVSKEPIKLLINSNGGRMESGLLIYDILQLIDAEVDMYCTGRASSMAAYILASGKKGHRFILKHSYTMIHEPLLLSDVGGSATDIKNMSNSILEAKDKMNKLLAYHTGHSLKEINKLTRHDHYMDAEESVKFGICDEIVDHI